MRRIGLISDTHMPERCLALPDAVFEVLAGVDLILHAGDVGELWVLDQLSRIAPVIAVHGNDDTPQAEAGLPYLQTIVVAGQRIVLTHAHYPDRTEEVASRSDDWESTFQRRMAFARQHGAEIIIFGHTHIPMCLQRKGIWLINPGAIAAGNTWTRQLIQTVAILEIEAGRAPQVTHYDLASGQPHQCIFDESGFRATFRHYGAPILEAELYQQAGWIWQELFPLAEDALRQAVLKLAHQRWAGDQSLITSQEMVAAIEAVDSKGLLRAKLAENPLFAPYISS